ncbi:MAG: heavy-metal-associated domain-containing protein [Gemmatimonadota bacterium]
MTTTTLKIQGMSCGHCVSAVTEALKGVEGVRSADVDLEGGRAVVEYDEGRATTAQLVGAVMDEGYTAEESV